MDIKDLKNKIETNTLDDSFLVLELEDITSLIIVKQYIERISKNKGLNIKYIDSIDEIQDDSFVVDDNLYVISMLGGYKDYKWVINEWKDPREHNNCIVICGKSDKGIKIPKLVDWNIVDYLSKRLSGLTKNDIEWLVNKYRGDYREPPLYQRLLNDTDKISIFDKDEQKEIFNELIDDGSFDTLSTYTIFNLSDGILSRDLSLVTSVYLIKDYIDCDPLPLWTILYKNFKNIVLIENNRNITAKDLGMSDKQFFVMKKYKTGHYKKDELIKIMTMLTNIEYLYKFGGLSVNQLIDYLIIKIMGV